MHRAVLALALVISLAACGGFFRKGAPSGDPLRVCVRNGADGYGNLVAHVGSTRYDVMPNEEVCKPILEGPSSIRLTAATIGGGSMGRLTYVTTLYSNGSRCWRWRLDTTQASQSNLVPCDLGEGE